MRLPMLEDTVNRPGLTAEAGAVRANPAALVGNAAAYTGQIADTVTRVAAQRAAEAKQAQDQAEAVTAQKMVSETNLAWAQQLEDEAQKAPEGAPNFGKQMLDTFETDAKARIQQVPEGAARNWAQGRLDDIRTEYGLKAIGVEHSAGEKKQLTDLDAIRTTNANSVRQDISQLGSATAATIGAINASSLNADAKRAATDTARETMAIAAIQGEVDRDPARAKTLLASGDFKASLSPKNYDALLGSADLEIKRRAAEGKAAARDAQLERQADVGARFDDAKTSLAATGVMPMVNGKPLTSMAEVRAAFPGIRGELYARQLQSAQESGALAESTKTTTLAEDEARIAALQAKPGEIFTADDKLLLDHATDLITAKKQALNAEIQGDLKESATEAGDVVARNIDDWAQTAFTTGKVPEEAKATITEADQGATAANKLAALDQLAKLGDLQQRVETGAVEADDGLLQSLRDEAKAGGAGSAAAQTLADKLQAVVADKRKLFETDPASGAAQTSSAVRAAWKTLAELQGDQAANPGKIQAAAKTAIALSTEEQQRQGINPLDQKLLPKAQRDQAVQAITQAAPAEVANTVDSIVSIYGMKGLKEIVAAGAPPSVIPIAGAGDPADGPWRSVLIKASQAPAGELARQAETRGIKPGDIDTAIQDLPQEMRDTLSGPYIDAIRNVALYEAANAQVRTAGAAVAFATAPFHRGYSFHSNEGGLGAYSVPSTFDDHRVTEGLQAIVAAVGTKYALQAEESFSGNPVVVDPLYRAQQQAKAIREGRYGWTGNNAGDGLLLTYETGDPVLLASGKPLEVKFEQAQAVGAPPRPGGRIGFTAPAAQHLPELGQ